MLKSSLRKRKVVTIIDNNRILLPFIFSLMHEIKKNCLSIAVPTTVPLPLPSIFFSFFFHFSRNRINLLVCIFFVSLPFFLFPLLLHVIKRRALDLFVITFTLYYHTTQAGRILIKISQADFKRRKKYKNNNAKNKKEDNHINHAR